MDSDDDAAIRASVADAYRRTVSASSGIAVVRDSTDIGGVISQTYSVQKTAGDDWYTLEDAGDGLPIETLSVGGLVYAKVGPQDWMRSAQATARVEPPYGSPSEPMENYLGRLSGSLVGLKSEVVEDHEGRIVIRVSGRSTAIEHTVIPPNSEVEFLIGQEDSILYRMEFTCEVKYAGDATGTRHYVAEYSDVGGDVVLPRLR